MSRSLIWLVSFFTWKLIWSIRYWKTPLCVLVIPFNDDPLDPSIEKGSRGFVLNDTFRFAGPFSPDGVTAYLAR